MKVYGDVDDLFIGRMPSYGIWSPVSLVRTDDSEEHVATIFRVKWISELRRTLAVISDTFLRKVGSSKTHDGVTSQKTAFLIVMAEKTSNLSNLFIYLFIYLLDCLQISRDCSSGRNM
jgi:hypothetical protein